MPGQALTPVPQPCGLFGKAPAAGDFLRLHLPAAVVSTLDDWAADELTLLAEDDPEWKTEFQDAPVWRFVASADVAGVAPLAGVIGPSQDRVGRAFPCMAVAVLHDLEPQAAVACTPWFDSAEALLHSARSGDLDLDDLIAALTRLRAPKPDDLDVLSLRGRSTDDGLFLDVRSGPDGRAVTLQAVLETTPLAAGTSLWWRHTAKGAKMMLIPGLPARSAFGALFQGPEEASVVTTKRPVRTAPPPVAP